MENVSIDDDDGDDDEDEEEEEEDKEDKEEEEEKGEEEEEEEEDSTLTEIPGRLLGGRFEVKNDDNEWVDVTKRVKKNTFVSSPVGVVPNGGYVTRTNYSAMAILWLKWLSRENNTVLQHALSDLGEFKIPGTSYYVDGYDQQLCTVYEFHGCLFHGCLKCFPHERSTLKHPYTEQTLNELYRATEVKKKRLQELGYNYVEMWECEFKTCLRENVELTAFAKECDITTRLDPRDAFFGGRTNALTLYHEVDVSEKIHYVDYTSLYPYICKYARYPSGHPEIITRDFKDIRDYFGIAKVRILPPDSLYHPVLPYRVKDKLLFPLCANCAEKALQAPCRCTQSERMLVGTWCTPELQKALEMGYKLDHIYEVHHFNKTAEGEENGLFAGFINAFLKIKQEASGWPNWCQTQDDKKRYVEEYKRHEGIALDVSKIPETGQNEGLRSLAKLLLNSLWGKFGQRANMLQCQYISDTEAEKLFQIISDPSKIVSSFDIVSPEMLAVFWKRTENFARHAPNTNIYLAAFTTCWARLKLYTDLNLLGRRVLYTDTDSIVYISDGISPDPPLGDFLGELTNELKEGDFITRFVSAGPKNYAYTTVKGEIVCKVRGFTLNHANSLLINFEAIRDVVFAGREESKAIETRNPHKIKRYKLNQMITSHDERKRYKMVYNKRWLNPKSLKTVPIGWKGDEN